MLKLLHNNLMVSQAIELYAAAKGIQIKSEIADKLTSAHRDLLESLYYGNNALPILIVDKETYITTIRGIVDYIESTMRNPKLLCSDPSPNAAQIAKVHTLIDAVTHTLYIDPHKPASIETHKAWTEMFTDMFNVIAEHNTYLDPACFTILDCFFYPATNVYLALYRNDTSKESIKNEVWNYRERIENNTIHKINNPDPELWLNA